MMGKRKISMSACCICGEKVPTHIAMLVYEIMRAPEWWKYNVRHWWPLG